MEAGHYEKGARERVDLEVQAPPERGDELVQLTELEGQTEDDRGGPEHEKSSPVVMREGVCSEVECECAREQDDRVDDGDRGNGDIELFGAGGWRWRPNVVRAKQVEVHREQAPEEHHLGGQEDVHAPHSGLDRRVFRSRFVRGLVLHRCDSHQWCTSAPGSTLSAGYIFTSSTSTQPATPYKKIKAPMTASVIRVVEEKGIAANPKKKTPRQMTNGQLLFGNRWMPSSRARATKSK